MTTQGRVAGSGPPRSWQPTAGWQLKRVLAIAIPVFAVTYLIARQLFTLPDWFYVCGLFLVPIALVVVVRSRLPRRSRRNRLQVLAAERGWSFSNVTERLDVLATIAANIPRFVWNDRHGSARPGQDTR